LENQPDTSISFCSSVTDTMHQARNWGAGTMYSTIYDLQDGTVYLYYFRDYTRVVKFNLNQELKKDEYCLSIPRLFPDNQKGQDFLNHYNTINSSLDLYADEAIATDSIRYKNVTNTLFTHDIRLIGRFTNKIDEIGSTWMDKENYAAAINICKISVKLSPNSWVAYKTLADAYLKDKQNDMALVNYEKSIELNPDNPELRTMADQLRKTKQ
jgi:tetratricopeptide (TPR) repeat protein